MNLAGQNGATEQECSSESDFTLPFEQGAGLITSDDPSPDLADNARYRVLSNFHSDFLQTDRAIRVYLPEAYLSEPERRFPVFYLHDAQNLFDGRTSYVVNRTWRAHLAADGLTEARLIEPVILVGVDNTGVRRMAEYTPTRDMRMGGGDGPRYGRLLIEELKPLIDEHFRTLADAANTGLGGSSLGGLISLALGLDYPEVFGKLAVMSPSVWWNQRALLMMVSESTPRPRPRIWLDMGTSEACDTCVIAICCSTDCLTVAGNSIATCATCVFQVDSTTKRLGRGGSIRC